MEREAKPQSKLDVAAIFTVAATGALVVGIAVIALQAYYESTVAAEEERKATRDIDTELRSLRAAQLTRLSEYRWVDQAKHTVTIPIEIAMEKVLQDVAAGRPSLVPGAVPAHDQPTVAPLWGRPPDNPTPRPSLGASGAADAEGPPATIEAAPGTTEPAPATTEPASSVRRAPAP